MRSWFAGFVDQTCDFNEHSNAGLTFASVSFQFQTKQVFREFRIFELLVQPDVRFAATYFLQFREVPNNKNLSDFFPPQYRLTLMGIIFEKATHVAISRMFHPVR